VLGGGDIQLILYNLNFLNAMPRTNWEKSLISTYILFRVVGHPLGRVGVAHHVTVYILIFILYLFFFLSKG
jgi:hypothetical protein